MTLRSIRFNPVPHVDPASATTVHEWYQDKTGAFSAGFWASESSTLSVHYDEDEFCVLIEGTVELTDASGHLETYTAGESFLIPAGFKGIWRSVTPVRKFYVVHLPKDTAEAQAAAPEATGRTTD